MNKISLPYSGPVVRLADGTCWQAVEKSTSSAAASSTSIVSSFDDCDPCLAGDSGSPPEPLPDPDIDFCCQTGSWNILPMTGCYDGESCYNWGSLLGEKYCILDYIEGDISVSSCESCEQNHPEYPTWDGVFECGFYTPRCQFMTAKVKIGAVPIVSELRLQEHRPWTVVIYCPPYSTDHVIWYGEKRHGEHIQGIYYRMWGCSLIPSAIEIIEVT